MTPPLLPDDETLKATVEAFVKEYFTKNEGWERHCMVYALSCPAFQAWLRQREGWRPSEEAIAEACENGFWQSCSGCHETVDGQETGNYDYSTLFKCHAGSGCYECGGIGVIWQRFTKDDEKNYLDAHGIKQDASPTPAKPCRSAEEWVAEYNKLYDIGDDAPIDDKTFYENWMPDFVRRIQRDAQASPITPGCGICHRCGKKLGTSDDDLHTCTPGDFVWVPRELNSLDAMSIAIALKGQWFKAKDERDTEKVKRLYKAMLAQIAAAAGGEGK